ncbi:MAG TPA: tetratricopeptide repeat protein [Candidatus Acidoferrales bacterium]|nr:tetratricopeptide repeat protein [Candidatus Acidoferrales bacterium]
MLAEAEQAIEWNKTGSRLMNLGRYAEALPYFDKVLKINPDDKQAWFYKGVSLDILGRQE